MPESVVAITDHPNPAKSQKAVGHPGLIQINIQNSPPAYIHARDGCCAAGSKNVWQLDHENWSANFRAVLAPVNIVLFI
jgi:hypothetical protein